MSNLTKYTWTESESEDHLELLFDQEVEQEDEVDDVNELLYKMYGKDVTIDWRDEQTCWIY